MSKVVGQISTARTPVGWLAAALLLTTGCDKDSPSKPCPANRPAFHVQLTATDWALPSDTQLRVNYGGAETVRYRLRSGSSNEEILCCRPGKPQPGRIDFSGCGRDARPDASTEGAEGLNGEADAQTRALNCELWTNGAADVEITGSGYAPLIQTLEARLSEKEEIEQCRALVTVDVHLKLVRSDAGL